MNDIIKRAIIEQAEADLAAYPQYRGAWDGSQWFLVRITHKVTTKLGVAFEAGELTIAQADRNGPWLTAYSHRNTCDTSVPSLWAERL